ncbi:MAG TPA: hypothetical protein VI299_08825 [Polyangiales bacterium]
MRALFAVLLFIHAAAHAAAFMSAVGLGPRLLPPVLRDRATTFDTGELGSSLLGLCWAALSIALLVAAFGAFALPPWWATYSAVVLVSSLCLSLIEWRVCLAARLCVVANAVLLSILWSSHLLDLVL